ncbi:transcriptional regulator [Novosphingobium sp. FKTRR1]|uniref:transcriptional regulator n=1 Tax=Novosphingobium sp. FKTRR1 TaxID=2879118 RepID=UPI001CF09901|nr:transcriptional regulator [Novosphingobium sp. FKTRR1]
MTSTDQISAINARLARLLTAAADRSGKSRREIARSADMNKDTFLRILRGEKAISLDDAMRVLEATGMASSSALLLAILGHEDLAVEWLGEDVGAFLDQFLTALPVTMNETLGHRIADLRPRWAVGTSRLVARLLAKHIDDFAERDMSLVLGR